MTLSRDSGQRGQSLVETALVLPVFILIMVALFDVGRLVYTNATISQAAREGARLAAAEAGWVGVTAPGCVTNEASIGSGNPGAHVCPPNVPALKADVVAGVNRMVTALSPVTTVYISCDDGPAGGDPAPTGAWTESSGGNGCVPTGGATAGQLVSVRIEYTYSPITPIIGLIIGSVPLSGSATMVVN